MAPPQRLDGPYSSCLDDGYVPTAYWTATCDDAATATAVEVSAVSRVLYL